MRGPGRRACARPTWGWCSAPSSRPCGLHLQARADDDKVLDLDPDYVDAELVVGVHQYVIGSLPLPIKLMAGVAGIHGSKDKGSGAAAG